MNEVLTSLDGRFGEVSPEIGRPSIPPAQLLRAMLQAFHLVRSERQPMEQLAFDLLFRRFVGLGVDDPVWDASTCSKNHDRLLDGSVAAVRMRGRERVDMAFAFSAAACNLICLPGLLAEPKVA